MLRQDIARHLELHRSMGFKYKAATYMLASFAAFAEERNEQFIKADMVLEWAATACSVRQRQDRLLVLRRFAHVIRAEDARHEVPPGNVFGRRVVQHQLCHIFTPVEIGLLLRAAGQLTPIGSIRPVTYTALFSLLAATGLRISEALKLRLPDISEDGLVIRETKFQKSRLVPIHDTVRRGLQRYLTARKLTGTQDPTVFVSSRGVSLPYPTVNRTFLRLVRSIGLRKGPGCGGCHIHDLRHTFAVRSLEQCGSDRKAISRHMTALSTYLGHAHVSDTYWYLQATPKLLGDVALAAEALHRGEQ